MKFDSGKERVQNWTRFIALFVLLYALSDVSVLQVYSGNEALGIPPDHHMSDSGHQIVPTTETPCIDGQADCKQIPDDHDYDHQHQCFCWQQVGVAVYSFELRPIANLTTAQPTVFVKEQHSNSAIFDLFRPPRTA